MIPAFKAYTILLCVGNIVAWLVEGYGRKECWTHLAHTPCLFNIVGSQQESLNRRRFPGRIGSWEKCYISQAERCLLYGFEIFYGEPGNHTFLILSKISATQSKRMFIWLILSIDFVIERRYFGSERSLLYSLAAAFSERMGCMAIR